MSLDRLEERLLLAATTLTVAPASGTYGGTADLAAGLTSGGAPVLNEIIDFHMGADDLGTTTTGVSGVATIDNVSLDGFDVGTYTNEITASFAGDSGTGYTASSGANSLTVNPAALTITANPVSKTYGTTTTLGTTNFTTTGLVNEDSVTGVTLTSPGAASMATVSGSPYLITPSAAVGSGLSNYTITYDTGNLTVTAAALTITASPVSKTYGTTTTLGTTNFTTTGLVNEDSVTGVTLTSPGAASMATVSGSPYLITPSAAVGSGLGNYTITYDTGNLTVTAAALTITANNLTKVYGAALPTLTASYSGFVNSDTSASLATQPTLTTTATAASTVAGSPYPITVSGAVDTNYTISYVAGSLAVTTAPLIVTANNETKVYGAALPTLTASFTGFVNGDTSFNLATQPTLATTANANSHVAGNPYPITVSGAADSNYSISYVDGDLTVATAPLTITAANQTTVYGATLPTLTVSYSGFVDGDTSLSLTTPPTITSTGTSASHVAGSPYAINASGAVDPDYSFFYVPGDLTVTAASLTITANNQTSVYGATLPTFTASYSGFVNGDTSYSLTTPPTITSTGTSASQVVDSPYPITASGAIDPDYTISYVPGNLTITPASLTITANNATKLYGQAIPALTGTISGVVNGDSITALFTTTATPSSDVVAGGYPITLLELSGTDLSDYNVVSSTAGTLTVTPTPLTIAAVNSTKIYGQPNPTLTATYSGFVLGQNPSVLSGTLSLNTQVTASTHFGIYAIVPSGLSSPDYAINYVIAGIAVTPAPLVITAPSLFKSYGQAVPTLTPTFSGFVNGDTAANLTTPVNVSTSASAASHVGFYQTIVAGASSLDYAITFTPGILANVPALLVVTPGSGFYATGLPVPILTATYTGFVNGDTAANLTTPVTLSTSATASSGPGFYAVLGSGASSNDYTIRYNYGILDLLTPPAPPLNPAQVAFVNSLYEDILGRAAEDFGLNFWINDLNLGVTRAAVAQAIYNSAEARSYRVTHHTITEHNALTNAQRAQANATQA